MTPRFTKKELEIIKLVSRGLTNKEIGAILYISDKTVDCHIRNALSKFNKRNRLELAIYAIARKLIRFPEQPEPAPCIFKFLKRV